MWDVVCLVLALAGLVLVLQLRAVLGFVFPLYRARVLPPGTAAPTDLQDLYAQADAELKALGYEGPAWFWRDADPQAASPERMAAAYRQPQDGSVFWLLSPSYAHAANRLSAYVVSQLVDGRLAISQAYDSYFAATAVGQVEVQTAMPDSHAALAAQHRQWRATLGAAVAPDSAAPATILDTAAPWMNRQRDRLLARGDLWRDAAGVARPRLGLALRLLRAYWRQPRMPKDTQPVPAGRLVHFALLAEGVAARLLPARLQWLFFVLSALAFALLGAWVWDWHSTLLLLLVIAIHEGGHYLAMRLFGYRNVHMVALPLLGGVTMGEEVKPSAAHRAWTSLMGPLPGIVIGWVLLASAWGNWPWREGQAPEVVSAALIFLGLNYLNLLPVPPLDGARIVEAMFRPGWAWARAMFVVLACAAGIVAAVIIGLPLLGVLAALQLLAVPGLLKQGRLLKAAQVQGVPPKEVPRAQRLRHVFALLEQLAGPAKAAGLRVKQARELLHSADQTPLGWAHSGLLVLVLTALLSVPAAATLLYFQSFRVPTVDAKQAEQQRRQELHIQQQARALPLAALVAPLAEAHGRRSPGATPDLLREAETRLGVALPAEVAAVWAVADGLPGLGLAPAAQLAKARREELEPLATNGVLAVRPLSPPGDPTASAPGSPPTRIALAATQPWLRLSEPGQDDRDTRLFYDPAPTPAVPGQRLIMLSLGEVSAYPDLRTYLEAAWQGQQQAALREQRLAVKRTQLRAEWGEATVPQLLAKFDQAGWAQRLLLQLPKAWPAGAPEAAITAAAKRLASPLPDDLRQLYQQHNGFPPLRIVPVEQLARSNAWPASQGQLETAGDGYDLRGAEGQEPTLHLDPQDLQHCVVVASFHRPPAAEGPVSVPPSLWWCPADKAAPERWVSVMDRRIYPSLTALLLHTAAARQAMRTTAY